MADEEHLTLLRQRTAHEWNEWRTHNRYVRPDLREADLRGSILRGIDLSRADLSRANLREAELSEANLQGVDLERTDLRGAHLHLANLSHSNLIGVDLSGADLSEARLSVANLVRTNFCRTNLSNAIAINCIMGGTVLAFTDLSTVRGLDTIEHEAPSTLDLNSVILPSEPLRIAFLRGVGFPENLIDYYDAIFTQPLQFYSCFLSYTESDAVFARKLYKDLQKAGIRCFFAPHDLRPGDYYHKRIDQAIQTHDKLLLFLSEQSVQSAWVEHEVMKALGREKREKREILFPLRLDESVMHTDTDWALALRDTRHIGDFAHWQDEVAYKQAFTRLRDHLKVGPLDMHR